MIQAIGDFQPTSMTCTSSVGAFKLCEPDWQQQIDALRSKVGAEQPDLTVGPNDILILRIKTTDVPRARIEGFLLKVKENLRPVWEKVGIADRVLCMAGDSQGFSVIHIQKTYGEKRSEPPVIG